MADIKGRNKVIPGNQLWQRRKPKIDAPVDIAQQKALDSVPAPVQPAAETVKSANYRKFAKLAGYSDSDTSWYPSWNYTKVDDAANLMRYNPELAANTLIMDTELNPVQKAIAVTMIADANEQSERPGFHTSDLIKAGIGAGLGYGAASITGKILGAVFGLSSQHQSTLARAGAVGGLLKATGIWK